MQRLLKFDVSCGFTSSPGSTHRRSAGIRSRLRHSGALRADAGSPPTCGGKPICTGVFLRGGLPRFTAIGGLIAWLITFTHAWYSVMPATHSFMVDDPARPERVILTAASSLSVLVLAELVRRIVAIAVAQRNAEISRGAMLMQELEHRTKNNSALVASLLELELQRKNAEDSQVRQALALA